MRIEEPLIGHTIPFTVDETTIGDTFAYVAGFPTELTGESGLTEDPQCGFSVPRTHTADLQSDLTHL